MDTQGSCGRGAREYGDRLAALRGRLASEDHRPVYPDDYCLACAREGLIDNEQCFHKHWETTDEGRGRERRSQ